MLRPPPCLWQTRQWIISPSGTRPSAVGLRGKGAVIQHSAKELPLCMCVACTTSALTLVCIVCTSTVYSLCSTIFSSCALCSLFLYRADIALTVSINRAFHKIKKVQLKQNDPEYPLSTWTWVRSCKIHAVQNKCTKCQRAITSCPLQVDCVDLAGVLLRRSTVLTKTVICSYFSQTLSHLPYQLEKWILVHVPNKSCPRTSWNQRTPAECLLKHRCWPPAFLPRLKALQLLQRIEFQQYFNDYSNKTNWFIQADELGPVYRLHYTQI